MYKPLKSIVVLFSLFIVGCSTLVIKNADFGWPLESVLQADENGDVSEPRYAVSFNIKQIYFEETGDSSRAVNSEIRIIRSGDGFYFVSADKFKNVYVFEAEDGTLALERKILVSPAGLDSPAFNQREPYIELLDGNKKINITSKGIQGK